MGYTPKLSGGKRLMIDKANATMMIVVGVTSFVVVFSLVASRALLSQSGYQSRVLKKRNEALNILKENNNNITSLVDSYKSFASETQNVLDGNPEGDGESDGDNPKIVLDALPSKYDFPGLISSIEKLLNDKGYKLEKIGGIDDEVTQHEGTSVTPQPIDMPFPVSVKTNVTGMQNVLQLMELSIRPIYVQKLKVTAEQGGALLVDISAKSFYQPEKTLKIRTEVVK